LMVLPLIFIGFSEGVGASLERRANGRSP